MRRVFADLAFAPASRRTLVAARVVTAAYALWLVASRPMLWATTEWPAPFFPTKHPTFLIRFGLRIVPPAVEQILYFALALLLLAVMLGVKPRLTALGASLLLYHFAPLEEVATGIFSNGNSGFSFPTLALAVLAFPKYDDGEKSPEYRWPVVLLQTLLALQYVLGGLSKIRHSGIAWYDGENVARTLKQTATLTGAPWGYAAGDSLPLAWAISIGTFCIEYFLPLAIVSRRARFVLVPAAFAAAILRVQFYGLFTLTAPLLLLFVNWDFVAERLRVRSAARAAQAEVA